MRINYVFIEVENTYFFKNKSARIHVFIKKKKIKRIDASLSGFKAGEKVETP